MANPPAGWHPDPLNRHAQRYWDGEQWTEHVADESGNMSTDPLDAGQGGQQQAQQDQYGQEGAWGGESTESSGQPAGWAEQDTSATPSWGETDTTTTDTDTGGVPDWHEPDPEAGAGAATGAAAGAAAGAEAGTATTTTGADAEPAVADADTAPGLPTVEQSTVAAVDVTAGAVTRRGSVVAHDADVTATDSAHPGCVDLSGSGTAHVAAGGRAIAVREVPGAGLTVRDDALLAHGGDLERAAASDGIVGYDATSLTGTGWVAVAAPGGVVEVSPTGGVTVTAAALVAFSGDLDVSHGDDVHLNGRGVVLVSAETTD